MSIEVTSWLPNLLGPLDLQVEGVAADVPRRSTFNFIGITVEDDPDNDRTNIEALGAGGSTPTGSGFRRVVAGVEDAAASAVNLAGGATHVTGTLPVANGGTGAATHTANTVLLGNGTGALLPGYEVHASNLIQSSKSRVGNGTAQGASEGRADLAMADANQVVPSATYSREGIKTTGVLTADRTATMPLPASLDEIYYKTWQNECTGANVIVSVGVGNTATLPAGEQVFRLLFSSAGVRIISSTPVGADGDVQVRLGTGTNTKLSSVSSTGTGNVVRANTPTLVTPVIGAATGTSVALTSFCSTGAIPAASGQYRLSSNASTAGVFVRNAGNTADINLISEDTSGTISVGHGTNADVVSVKAATAVNSVVGATTHLSVTTAGARISTTLKLADSDNSHSYVFVGSNLAADRNLTLPLLAANDTMAVLGLAQTFSALQTFTASTARGATPATAGTDRFSNDSTAQGRRVANDGDVVLWHWGTGNELFVGTNEGFTSTQPGNVRISSAGYVMLGGGSGNQDLVVGNTGGINGTRLPIVGHGSSPHAMSGRAPQAMADANQTPAAAVYSRAEIQCTGALTAIRTLTLPHPASEDASYEKKIENATTGGFSITVSTGTGTTYALALGTKKVSITPSGVKVVE